MSNVPWSVKGVEFEAREAAKLAARKAGLPLGVWLSQTIHAAAAQQLKNPAQSAAGQAHAAPPYGGGPAYGGYAPPPGAASYQAPPYGQGQPPGYGAARPPALTPEAVLESINRLASKIEETESRTAETLAPIVDKVNKLSEQISEVRKDRSIETDPLERAMMRMSERLDQIEGGGRAPRREPDGAASYSDLAPNRARRRPGFFARLFSD